MNSSESEVKQQIRARYANVARSPESEQVFPVGPDSAKKLGYAANEIDGLPVEVTESFSGVGNPLSLGHIETGHTVLDLGCGSGLDSILAARRVGPTGTVICIDMTPEMLDKAKRNAVSAGVGNVEFLLGDAEELPVADETVNVVITNGVFNLCLDKPKILTGLHRVLRPGGCLQMADILLHDDVTEEEIVDLVESLVESGRAQCVLGNHDLNILLKHRKHDNGWFFGDEFTKDGIVVPQVLADESIRQRVLEFFRTLPIALERDDLRVIHACWHDAMIAIARESNDVMDLYNEHHELIESGFPDLELDDIDKGLEHQNKNPVKLLSSGPEERIDKPIHSGGKARNEQRVQWRNGYDGSFCVFGHYSITGGDPRGNGSTFCVDYGVGKRWTERRAGKTHDFKLKLAALRWPERVVVFDEGEVGNSQRIT